MGLRFAIDLLCLPVLLFFAFEGCFQALLDETFAKSFDRAGMDIEGVLDLFVGPAFALRTQEARLEYVSVLLAPVMLELTRFRGHDLSGNRLAGCEFSKGKLGKAER